MKPSPSQESVSADKLPPVVCGGTPARLRRVYLKAAAATLFVLVTLPIALRVLLLDPNEYFAQRPPRDCYAQLAHLRRRVDWLTANPDWRPRRQPSSSVMATEWPLFSLSFLSFAAYELARRDDACRRPAAMLIKDCIEEARRRRTYGFVVADWGDPFREDCTLEGNMLYLGHLNLMLARYRELADDARYDTLFHRLSVAVHRNLERSPTHNVDSYPGYCWPSDQVIPLVSLVAHDRLFGTAYGEIAEKWLAWVKDHLDAETGLFPAMIDADTGEHLQRPRGCALGWAIPFLYDLDPDFAQNQYDRFVRHHHVRFLGLGAFREWPRGNRGFRDVDTGPLVFGIGPSASAFGLAAAKAAGDRAVFGEVLHLGEALGWPFMFLGRTNYLASPRVGDTVVLWAKAVAPRHPPGPAYRAHGSWRLVYALLFGALFSWVLSILIAAMQRAQAGLRLCRYVRDGQFGRAATLVESMRSGRLSPIDRRAQGEFQALVTRAMMLPASARQEWVRKSNLVGWVFGTLSGMGLLFAFGVLCAFHAHASWYVAALVLAYFVLGGIEWWVDNRLWRRLTSAL